MLSSISKLSFLGANQRRLLQQGVPVFTYHKLAPPNANTRDPFLYVSPRRFDEQLAKLKEHGYQSGTLDDVKSGLDTKSKLKAIITFDDGFCSVLENGLKVLARHQFQAIQFIVAGSLGGRNDWDVAKKDVSEPLMDEVQIKEWLAAGHEIGSHSMTHKNLRHLAPAEAREEIIGSKKRLEDIFGLPIKHFCYPYGSWNESVRDLVKEAGYSTACTVLFGVNGSQTSPFELRRIIPLSNAELLAKIRHRLLRKIGLI